MDWKNSGHFGIVTVMCLVLCSSLQAQNLVPNPSFEAHNGCPEGLTDDWSKVQYWYNANGGTPDYFHLCGADAPSGSALAGVPLNNRGQQWPVSGNAYMGFYGVQIGNQQWREYLQAELTKPLYFRFRYVVSFYVSLSESSQLAISTIGAHLSEQPPSSSDMLVLDLEPQILPHPLQPITDTTNWVLVTDTFRSMHGGERFITIGNFFSNEQSDTLLFNPNPNPPSGNYRAYYYIDDVSVVALDSVPSGVGITEQEALGFEVYPNPATDVVRFRVLDSSARSSVGMTVGVLDAVGRVLRYTTLTRGTQDDHAVDISALPTGIYFLELTNTEGRKAVRKFVKE